MAKDTLRSEICSTCSLPMAWVVFYNAADPAIRKHCAVGGKCACGAVSFSTEEANWIGLLNENGDMVKGFELEIEWSIDLPFGSSGGVN